MWFSSKSLTFLSLKLSAAATFIDSSRSTLLHWMLPWEKKSFNVLIPAWSRKLKTRDVVQNTCLVENNLEFD